MTTGIYRYIRHPMYSSLMLLTCGALIKHVSVLSLVLAVVAAGFLLIAAKYEELENVAYFGGLYRDYMKASKRFLPGLF